MRANLALRVLDSIAGDSVPETVNLLPRITALFGGSPNRRTLRERPMLILFLVALVLSLLACVAYTVARSLGYIPGVGLVENNNLLILPKPVSVERNGVTITVEKVIADTTQTYVQYKVAGVSLSVNSSWCIDSPVLQLTNGDRLNASGGGAFGMESDSPFFTRDVLYPPLPAGSRRVIFLSPCGMPFMELNLVPAPAGFTTPVEDVGAVFTSVGPQLPTTPTPELQRSLIPYGTSSPPTPTSVPHGTGLYLDRVLEMDDAYVLIGNFTNTGDLPGSVDFNYPITDIFQIHDSKGQPILFYQERDDMLPATRWENAWYWAIELFKPVDGPITIAIPVIHLNKEDDYSLPLDVGSNPSPGQKWVFNRPFNLGGYNYFLEDITREENGYTVRYLSDRNVLNDPNSSFSITIIAGDSMPSSEESSSNPSGNKSEHRDRFQYDDPPPVGKLTFLFTLSYTVPFSGPWTLVWSPPKR
jgi:hypothetical protein